MKKELIDFAMEMAETIYSMQIESEGFMEMEDHSGDIIPIDFINNVVDNEKHADIMKTKMFSQLLADLVKYDDFVEKHREANGKLGYHPELIEYSFSGMAPYIKELYEKTTDEELLKSLPKKDFNIQVRRTSYGFNTIKVKARTYSEAEELALEEAGDHEYSEKEADYSIV